MQKTARPLLGALCFSFFPRLNRTLTRTLALTGLSLLSVSVAHADWTQSVVANPHLHQFQLTNSNSYDCIEAVQFRSEPHLNYVSLTIAVNEDCSTDALRKDMLASTKLPIMDFYFHQLYVQIPVIRAYEGFSILKSFASAGEINRQTLKKMMELLEDQIAFVSNLYADPEKLDEHYRNIGA